MNFVPEPTDMANSGSCFGVLVSCIEILGVTPGTAGTAENFGFAGIGEKKVWVIGGLLVGFVGTSSRFVGNAVNGVLVGVLVGIRVGALVGVLVGTACNTGNSFGALRWGTAGTAATAANEGLFFCRSFFSISSIFSPSPPSLLIVSPFAGLAVWLKLFVGCRVG